MFFYIIILFILPTLFSFFSIIFMYFCFLTFTVLCLNLCKAHWTVLLYEMRYINKIALPCLIYLFTINCFMRIVLWSFPLLQNVEVTSVIFMCEMHGSNSWPVSKQAVKMLVSNMVSTNYPDFPQIIFNSTRCIMTNFDSSNLCKYCHLNSCMKGFRPSQHHFNEHSNWFCPASKTLTDVPRNLNKSSLFSTLQQSTLFSFHKENSKCF